MPTVAHLYPEQTYLARKATAMVHAVAIMHRGSPALLSAAGDLLIAIDDGLPAELLMLLANSMPHAIAAVRSLASPTDTSGEGCEGKLKRAERFP